MIDNLNAVVTTINSRGNALAQTVTTLQQLVTGLAADRQPIGEAISALGSLTSATAGLLQVGRAPLRQDIVSLGQLATNLANNSPAVQTFLQNLPVKMDGHRPAGLLRVVAQLLPVRRHGDRRAQRPARHGRPRASRSPRRGARHESR